MRRLNPTRQRVGFTLIELLVVIAIIAALAALTVGAYFRVTSSQSLKRTETTVKKIATGLDGQWNAVIDDVKDEIKNGKVPAALLAAAGNDRDLANALYLKLRLQQEFPQTFAEAKAPAITAYGIPAKSYFTGELLTTTNAGNAPQVNEAAVLLFITLSQSRRGATFNVDDMGGGTTTTINMPTTSGNTKAFKVFVDSWKSPITFERWSLDNSLVTELSAPPYAPAGVANTDPGDQYNKLRAASNAIKNAFQGPLHDQFTGHNRGPFVRSAGPDKAFSASNNNDDILSYRLMKEGQRGN